MSYPVSFEVDYAKRRNRHTAALRLFLAIPLLILLVAHGIVALVALIGAWFALVFTARYPQGLYDFVAGVNRFGARATAYILLLCDSRDPDRRSPRRHRPAGRTRRSRGLVRDHPHGAAPRAAGSL